MSASHAPFLKSSPLVSTPHPFLIDDACPICEQPIPRDHFDEIKQRIDARQREQSSAISSRLQEQFAREKLEILEQAKQEADAVLEQQRQLTSEKIALAREEERQAAEVAAQEKIAAAQHASQVALSALQARNAETEAAGARLRAQLEAAQRESASAIQQVREEAVAKEASIRAEAQHSAEAAVQTKLVELEQAREASEMALHVSINGAQASEAVAEEARAALQTQLDHVRRETNEAIEKIRQEAVAREMEIRKEAGAVAEAAAKEKMAGMEQARSEAEAKATVAEERIIALTDSHEAQLAQRLEEQREAMERAQVEAVNAEKSAAFEDKMKLSVKVDDLQRALDKKTAEQLGEGAEIDLFEALKAEFEGDLIERINKGQPGADILHTVLHNGKECGKIIYDSKNHNSWRNDFVTKLSMDQMAAKAEHAILSTHKFPGGTRQLHVQDGVLLANPARVVALVTIMRQHLVQTNTLRLSNDARIQKTATLYRFITSERCSDLLTRFDTHAEDLLDIQVKEMKSHEATWKKQGELLRSVQKVRAEFCREIDTIIGTADATEMNQ